MSDYPYPGLRPFWREETDIFFGRDEHTDQLLEQLGKSSFVAVLGPSGCGKSSLVRTGLLPALEAGFLTSAGHLWRIAEFRPGPNPFAQMAKSLLDNLGQEYLAITGFGEDGDSQEYTDELRQVALTLLEKHLQRGPLALHEIWRDTGLPEDNRLLILVDQFEELFRYSNPEQVGQTAAFVALLLAACEHPALYVVITMRSDFIGDCAELYGLPEAINRGLYLTPRLTRGQLREAVELPAAVFGGRVEPALVNQLLNDAGSDPDQLPLLQHALMRMWNRAGRAQDTCTPVIGLGDYGEHSEIGRLADALSRHADQIFDRLDPSQQRIAETLFRCLTEIGPDNRPVRHPAKLSDVAGVADAPWAQVAEVAEVFRASWRAFLTPAVGTEELKPDTMFDLGHESLIRCWRRLNDWVRDEADAAALYRRLEAAALRHAQGQGELWRGLDLEEARLWLDRVKPTEAWAARYSSPTPSES